MALSEKHGGNKVGQRLSEYWSRKQIVKRSRKVERTGYRLNEFDEFGEVDVVSSEYVYSAEQGSEVGIKVTVEVINADDNLFVLAVLVCRTELE